MYTDTNILIFSHKRYPLDSPLKKPRAREVDTKSDVKVGVAAPSNVVDDAENREVDIYSVETRIPICCMVNTDCVRQIKDCMVNTKYIHFIE